MHAAIIAERKEAALSRTQKSGLEDQETMVSLPWNTFFAKILWNFSQDLEAVIRFLRLDRADKKSK